MSNHFNQIKARQSGVALITGLIFMVVMTIIVIAALRSATLEERMAANARNRQVGLQAAEAVLRDAETLFAAGAVAAPFSPFTPASFTVGCTNGLCNRPASGTTPRWQTVDWSSAAATRTFAIAASELDGVASQPRYIVEIVNVPINVGGGGICDKVLYRITARGVGMDNSTVFVQTMVWHLPAIC